MNDEEGYIRIFLKVEEAKSILRRKVYRVKHTTKSPTSLYDDDVSRLYIEENGYAELYLKINDKNTISKTQFVERFK